MNDNRTPVPAPDRERAVLPHRDPTFDAVLRSIQAGNQPVDWRISGPLLVRKHNPNPTARGGLDRSQELIKMPEIADRPVQLNLEPDVAVAVLRYLNHIAERRTSRSGKSATYGMKKGPAATGPQPHQNRSQNQETHHV